MVFGDFADGCPTTDPVRALPRFVAPPQSLMDWVRNCGDVRAAEYGFTPSIAHRVDRVGNVDLRLAV